MTSTKSKIDQVSILSHLSKLQQFEVILPILKMRALVSQLLVGDDVLIRTSITSPDLYEDAITKLAYNHIEFPENEKPDYETFKNNLVHIDRSAIIWGIINTSYTTLGEVDIICTNCGETFKDTITYDEMFQPDTFTLWDEDVSPKQFIIKTTVPINIDPIKEIIFRTKLPTVQDRIDLMNVIGLSVIKKNQELVRNIFTDSENLTLITDSIEIISTDKTSQTIVTPYDIYMAYTKSIPRNVAKNVLTDFEDKLGKYKPRFRKPYKCTSCNEQFDFEREPEEILYTNFFV